ncbi:ferric iron uptake transcriptional regulator [Wohlfahrtiimonas chitiniclastica]|uniref:Ferric uptake regulation protein n=2 Tax=Wohlfahrtiimonas chitiniclastica TaxID=400946 RepID=L8XXI1_9GAMM|nr:MULTISPECIES: ferric iron uptake transcriptional regulator [Wohlfahrtiimonas]ELV08758.1 Ferric uptake regulation protein [Wohlfahrtiimonas chitiniclastica SH04]KZS22420.1 transcriptional repressor [Wohlfahrtiimonas chitiniclastica]KZX37945.1 transcriptional repressor [Wohlfahrtiimonas chitiniclastica]MBS7813982.1 ferric iron uptake transcriptional regulator [Wohlfahrtiimonas chitiniclastica]MBS7816245.1 ferric iron uptake transcriptional regulator [Wohlfahrtiimonas chitiniclastica]
MGSEELKNAGLKVTLPRLKILNILVSASSEDHLSAEEIYQRLNESGEEVGLATVYRVLTQFEQAGLVQRHFFDGGQSVFELDNGDQHSHIVCVKCGYVDEFHKEEFRVKSEEIAKNFGYLFQEAKVTIYGICKRCQ